jgi:DNA repair protein RAD5
MLHAGDVDSALEALGAKTSNLSDVLEKRQKLEIEKLELRVRECREKSNTEGLKKAEASLVEAKKKLEQMKERIKELNEEDCPICYNTPDKPLLTPCCHKIYCSHCLVEWMKTKTDCPMCRAKIEVSKLVKISEKVEEKKPEEKKHEDIVATSKLASFKTLLNNLLLDKSKRVVIFSDYDATYTQVMQRVRSEMKQEGMENLNMLSLKGSKATREKQLNSFKNGEVRVMFLNSMENCAGINMQEVTDIVIYHDMSLTKEMQIIGRANRIGRNGNLSVHRFIQA